VDESEREELEHDITSFIRWAPTPDYDDATLEAIRAEPAVAVAFARYRESAATWPAILAAWRSAPLTAADLAKELVSRLGLSKRATAKTETYLEYASQGELDPARFSRRLLDTLADIVRLSATATTQAGSAMAPSAVAPAFRAGGGAAEKAREDLEFLADLASAPSQRDWDEVDDLFRGG
jgi:hypothetical protein